MRKIILDLAVTLDGFIEGPNGETDWCIMDDDMNFNEFLDSIDTIFYGRVSYDSWGTYQPEENAGPEEKEFWDTIHSKNKYVFSSQARKDSGAVFVSSDIAEKVTEIRLSREKISGFMAGLVSLKPLFILILLIFTGFQFTPLL
ncbi:hypothetical protein BN1195_03007 [Chryseobacterium oranimense G311]|uniref:dihydrofolate reductase family protein n=1 Tax=Chryseobacterium oranimense TaxID=421058 RepID=UPI0005339D07|nr:dihydrofolate reductase family protein [Chryseobacterium oranimense]CEJ70679.1 hypothetical protein BN1195_03007 [Chryseobacterium oranimense G311]